MTAKEENTNVELAYGIIQIKTKELSIHEPDTFVFEHVDVIGKVNFNIDVGMDFTAEISFEIITEFIDNTTQEKLVSHVGLTKYSIINTESIISKEDKTLHMPDKLMVMFYSMAHTHARALLATELKTTIFKDKLFIPIIDPSAILKYKPNS